MLTKLKKAIWPEKEVEHKENRPKTSEGGSRKKRMTEVMSDGIHIPGKAEVFSHDIGNDEDDNGDPRNTMWLRVFCCADFIPHSACKRYGLRDVKHGCFSCIESLVVEKNMTNKQDLWRVYKPSGEGNHGWR